jgi:hypothetical protein
MKMRRSYLQNTETKIEGSKKKKVVLILLFVVAAAVIMFIAFKGCLNTSLVEERRSTAIYLEDDSSSIEGEAQMKDKKEILAELEKQQIVVTDKLSSNITFQSGAVGTVGEWLVENPKENNVIAQAETYLDDVLIVKSSPIYPNQHITGVELLEEIKPGEYDVTAYLNYYNIDTKEFISKAGYAIHLTVR